MPQTARVWNYLLGGKDNFAADRAVGDQILQTLPQLAENARLSRAYLAWVVRYLTGVQIDRGHRPRVGRDHRRER